MVSEKNNSLSDTGEVAPSKTPEKNMTLKEVAAYLKRGTRTIYKWAKSGEIPCHKPAGNNYIFIRSEIDEWIRAGKPKIQKPAISETALENQPEYFFKVQSELFTDIFVEHGYLTKPNGERMAARFKAPPKEKNVPKIEWEKGMKSLLTFILVLEQFELIKTDESNITPQSLTLDGKDDGVALDPLISNNFIVKKGGQSPSTISRTRTKIMNTFNNIQGKIKMGSKDMTFKELLKYYYQNKDIITIAKEFKDGVDWTILKIFYDNVITRIST
jgi:excisionase family DNA binding protein